MTAMKAKMWLITDDDRVRLFINKTPCQAKTAKWKLARMLYGDTTTRKTWVAGARISTVSPLEPFVRVDSVFFGR